MSKTNENAVATMYNNAVDIGTEEMGQTDINTPVLKIIQPNTQGIENKKDGAFYRSETREMFESVDVNLVYVTTQDVENYNKDGIETVKIYFGFYKGTNEPFKMYCRGWGMASHRTFQTEVSQIKSKYKVPMLSLTVKLKTEKQTGTIGDTGKPYTTYKPVFDIYKDENGPVVEMNPDRISFLVEAANRFKNIAKTSSLTDEEQNEIIEKNDQGIKPEEIPF